MGVKILIGLNDFSGFTGVFSITVICYLFGLGLKSSKISDEKIPVLIGIAGGILGIIGNYLIPDFPATNILDAIAYGILSALSSVGVNQIFKQNRKVEKDGNVGSGHLPLE